MRKFADSHLESIAVIVTCFNRRELSVATIQEILQQAEALFDVKVFVTDDGSTDGTGSALRQLDDRVEVIQGSGSLYWAGGMRAASARASEHQVDWYMWVNDDLELQPSTMRSFYDQRHLMLDEDVKTTVFVGSVIDRSTNRVAYGRRVQNHKRPLSFSLAQQGASSADSFNGNLVIFPAPLYRRLGGFPKRYRHGYADYVMGLNVSQSGMRIEELQAIPSIDSGGLKTPVIFDPAVPLLRRLKASASPFGLPPVDHFRFCWRVAGPRRAVIWFLLSYGRVLFPRGRRRRD